MRNATSTRHEYEGQKLMSTLARHLMHTAATKGFKTANIECLNDRVTVGSEILFPLFSSFFLFLSEIR